MRISTKAVLAAALLAGASTSGFSAMPEGDLANLDRVMGLKLVSIEGSVMVITPSERQLAREVVAPNGVAQKTLFTFLTEKLGTVSSASGPVKALGVFRIIDAGIEIRYADGSQEILAANDSGGISSELISGASDSCISWYPENHVFSRDEREAALVQYANRLGIAETSEIKARAKCGGSRTGGTAANGTAAPQTATLSPQALREIAQVEAEVERIEAETLNRIAEPPDSRIEQIGLLGEALLYDRQLSVLRNEACAFCHLPQAGFAGPLPELNRTTGSYPGSVRTRFGNRKPQSNSYAALAPVLHFNPSRKLLIGGNFWDMRATGLRLGSPAAEQAEMPLTNPVEMGLPDAACAVYRASQRPYRAVFETAWGAQSFAINWPDNVEQVCSRPGPPPAGDAAPVHLSPSDRGRVAATLDQMAQSIASFEASVEVSSFSSKFDAVQAGQAKFTQEEQAGLDLFRGKAKCGACHEDTGPAPLFTNFTASNTGVPANRHLPFYAENRPDALGFTANPAGSSFTDGGVGKFLSASMDSRLSGLAPQNLARFRVPTLRNVDKRPDPGFVKAYGHNGYFKDLKTVVHFYNTRDVLRRCQTDDEGEGKTCWPAPESTDNIATTIVGRLGLTDAEEDAVVSFLKTLSDGFTPPPP